jgi:dUTP pyrophosphatase
MNNTKYKLAEILLFREGREEVWVRTDEPEYIYTDGKGKFAYVYGYPDNKFVTDLDTVTVAESLLEWEIVTDGLVFDDIVYEAQEHFQITEMLAATPLDESQRYFSGPYINIPVKKLSPDAVIPTRGTEHSAGWDLTAISAEWKDNNTVILHTGIAVEIPEGNYLEIVPRSSIVKTPFFLANSVGIIDTDYRGELMIALKYVGDKPELELPWRCAQLIVREEISSRTSFIETEELADTSRGTGGFGSTGRV